MDVPAPPLRRPPVLVTGMPRSGTTWLARLLATAPGTALAGREPMNPRGRQYALAGTLPGWAELTALSEQQERALRRAYRGRSPWVFSRYGRRQWAAPLPWTRLVIKDPFAMLSVPSAVRTTSAAAVLLYRHPGAALASYRRMGWQPDLDELRPILDRHQQSHSGTGTGTRLPRPGEVEPAEAMGCFWSALYEIALDHAAEVPRLLIVSHEELATGGIPAARRLFAALGLRWGKGTETELLRESGGSGSASASAGLHDFARSPREVAGAWRGQLGAGELERVEAVTADARARLHDARFALTDS